MENGEIMQSVLSGMGIVAAVLLGVWTIVARYDGQLRRRMDEQLGELRKETSEQLEQLRDRGKAHAKETSEQLGQLRERMAKLEGLLEGLREAITGKRAA